jgi:hypothetical protein
MVVHGQLQFDDAHDRVLLIDTFAALLFPPCLRPVMGKSRRKKTPVTTSVTKSTSSSKPEATRKVIRQLHVLLKQKAQLDAIPIQKRDAMTVKTLEDTKAHIDELGGLEFYQRMSAIGPRKLTSTPWQIRLMEG